MKWRMKKYSKNGNGVTAIKQHVSLHPEVNRQIRELYENMNLLVDRDIKAMKDHQEKMAEHLEKIAKCLEKTSEAQEKCTKTLEKIDRRQEVETEVRKRTTVGLVE